MGPGCDQYGTYAAMSLDRAAHSTKSGILPAFPCSSGARMRAPQAYCRRLLAVSARPMKSAVEAGCVVNNVEISMAQADRPTTGWTECSPGSVPARGGSRG